MVDAVLRRTPASVLDIGCGEGWLSRALAAHGIRTIGVDVVPALVALATEAGGDFRVASYDTITLDRPVDVAVANFALLGREPVEALLRPCARCRVTPRVGGPMSFAASEPEVLVYPEEDGVAETVLHFMIRSLLFALVRRWLAQRQIRAFVGSDQFVYWVRGSPTRSLAPDLFVVFGEDPESPVRSWKVWDRGGVVPRFALEVVSDDVEKDYVLGPLRYAELGVEELVIFDPEAEQSAGRVRWQVYRRRGADLVEVAEHDGDRVESEVLGCHLRCVVQEGRAMVRLGTGPDGDELVPTAEEAERARRVALEAEVEALRKRLGDER